ncbi:MAG: hypothetical protein LBO74_14540 [Candidatus Symbiothrix sp.]|nr:hypothetical protein [Candidatus Symbiothrix sp.]
MKTKIYLFASAMLLCASCKNETKQKEYVDNDGIESEYVDSEVPLIYDGIENWVEPLDERYLYLEYINDTTNSPFFHLPLWDFNLATDTLGAWYSDSDIFEGEVLGLLAYQRTFIRMEVNEIGSFRICFNKRKGDTRPYTFVIHLPNNVSSKYVGIFFVNTHDEYVEVSIPYDHNTKKYAIIKLGEMIYYKVYTANQAFVYLDDLNGEKVDLLALCLESKALILFFEYSDSEQYQQVIPLDGFKEQYNKMFRVRKKTIMAAKSGDSDFGRC